jgi:hypothetical protein
MGPGATDKWLASGADVSRLPKETQGYIRGVNLAQGGEVQQFRKGGEPEDRSEFQQDLIDMFGYSNAQNTRPEVPQYLQNIKGYFASPSSRSKDADAQPGGFYGGTAAKPIAIPQKPSVQPVMDVAGLTTDEMIAGSTRAGTLDALMNDQTTGRPLPDATKNAEAPKSLLDQQIERMLAREATIEKQRGDDKNMALLTAGLGMLGGTSPYAFENIGKGALAGVQSLGEARKQRGAEQAALDKSMLYATRYQGAEDIARQNAAYNRSLQGERLIETRRANTIKEMEQAQANLNNYVKIAQANLKDRFPAGEMDERYQSEMAKIYKSPEYIGLSKRAGLTIAAPTFPGFSAVPSKK